MRKNIGLVGSLAILTLLITACTSAGSTPDSNPSGTQKGNEAAMTEGFPTVVTDQNNVPQIKTPTGEMPAEFKKATLVKGSGAVVKIGDTVTLNYSGYLWDGTMFDSSWSRGEPAVFPLLEGQLISGFIKELDGETVGSRVIAIMPPSDGYGSRDLGTIPPNSTLIFIVEILGVN